MILDALELAIGLHGVSRLIIVDHVDCGAYGGSKQFDSAEEERRFHGERLHEAREVVADAQPEIEIVLLYQDHDGLSPIE